MKKLICKLSLLKFLIFALAFFVLAGCKSSQFYDSSSQNPAYTSPRQTTSAAQNVPADWATVPDASGSSVPPTTILREGDTVKVSFPGSPNLDASQQIRLDGKISLPLVGDVQAAGMTTAQLQQNLVKLYAPQISSSEINVAIESSAFPVYVTGCVLRPGKVLSDQPITALEAIMESGGFDYTRANLKNVHVIRRDNNSSQSYILDLKTVLKGNQQNNFFLQPGDIVYVPEKFSWF